MLLTATDTNTCNGWLATFSMKNQEKSTMRCLIRGKSSERATTRPGQMMSDTTSLHRRELVRTVHMILTHWDDFIFRDRWKQNRNWLIWQRRGGKYFRETSAEPSSQLQQPQNTKSQKPSDEAAPVPDHQGGHQTVSSSISDSRLRCWQEIGSQETYVQVNIQSGWYWHQDW